MLEIVLQHDPMEINWAYLSENPNVIHLLEANPMKINWDWLSTNPSIFEIDTKQYNIDLKKKANNIDDFLLVFIKN